MDITATINSMMQSRRAYILATLAGVAAMAYAYYLQLAKYMDPCPLCIFDRVFLVGLIITMAVAALHNPARNTQRFYAALMLVFCAGGLTSSGRHVWLQHLPADQVPGCGPGLNYLLDAFPVTDVFRMVLQGSGECADINWQFLGFSLPEVTLMMFLALTTFALIQLFRSRDENLF